VSGGSELFGGGSAAYATIKYGPNGDTLWVRRFEVGAGGGGPLALDDSANVYVTGHPVTIKYDTDGDERWVHEDEAAAFVGLALDPAGNVVAAGSGPGDFKAIKLDSDGGLLWAALYDGPARFADEGNDLAVDSEGNVVVAGQSWGLTSKGDGTQWNYTTVKYSPSGALRWARHYNGPAAALDVPTDLAWAVAVDPLDNVYVSGWSDGATDPAECLTIKYSPEGDTLWERRYADGGACYDLLYDGGFLYAASRGGGGDRLLKYDLEGNLVWVRLYATEIGFATNDPRLAADRDGNVYMTSLASGETRVDYVVVKYTPSGERAWVFVYPGVGEHQTNAAYGLAVDAAANVYVTGQGTGAGCGGVDYLTLKISQLPTSTEDPGTPAGYALHAPRPNPSRGTAEIAYDVGAPSHVRLRVYDALGRAVALLVDGWKPAGSYRAAFAASGLPGGVYLYRMEAGAFSQTRSLAVLR
jgi:hypothetical protein